MVIVYWFCSLLPNFTINCCSLVQVCGCLKKQEMLMLMAWYLYFNSNNLSSFLGILTAILLFSALGWSSSFNGSGCDWCNFWGCFSESDVSWSIKIRVILIPLVHWALSRKLSLSQHFTFVKKKVHISTL